VAWRAAVLRGGGSFAWGFVRGDTGWVSEESELEAVVAAIKASRKYRAMGIETIRALVRQAWPEHRKPKAVEKAVRRRLHGIAAVHLGDPDYGVLGEALAGVLAKGDAAGERALCEGALGRHLSTRERLPYLERFYAEIFEHTGVPGTMLDLACGLGPLALPWMGLPRSARVLAYDVHEPRVAMLGAWLRARGLAGGAEVRDIVLRPPTEPADVALLLKELHRLQRNYSGMVGVEWLASIPARHLVISLPAFSAHGGRRLVERYREMMGRLIAGRGWGVHEILFEHEVVFCLDTRPEGSYSPTSVCG
jgi:16S rRNA (guanine(1405)-N(7))-methyltransferase